MKKKIRYGSYAYSYCLIRQNRKTISLTIFPDLKMVIKAPNGLSDEKIEDFFKRKWQWIEKQRDFFKQFQIKSRGKEYVSGESFLYLGRQYKLIVKSSNKNRVSLEQSKLYLYTTGKVRDGKNNQRILLKWYQRRAENILKERYWEMRKKFSYQDFPIMAIRKMKKRWGSYTKSNRIMLNPFLIYAPKKCIDYVIVHELCHVKYPNHSRDFFLLLDRKFPDWERAKKRLELCQVKD